jgi:hypothetical protein
LKTAIQSIAAYAIIIGMAVALLLNLSDNYSKSTSK